MYARITLNNRWPSAEFPPIVWTVELHPSLAELGPEFWFDSMNRIDNQAQDLGRLLAKHADHREVGLLAIKARTALDALEAPSMSVGDMIELVASNGTTVLTHVCEPIGWSTIAPAPAV